MTQMTQEEIVHVPTIVQQDRIRQQQVEMIVEVPVPMMQEEIVHVPTIIQQERITQQHGEMSVEVPVPMTQEEIVRSEVHVPIAQEEIVNVPTTINRHRRARVDAAVRRAGRIPHHMEVETTLPMTQEVTGEDEAGPRARYVGRWEDLRSSSPSSSAED